MKKVLIFGATGTLGHKLYQTLGKDCDVIGTIRSGYKTISRYSFLEPTILVPRFDATAPGAVKQVIESIRPDVIVNCIGVIPALIEKTGEQAATYLNAVLPHDIYKIARTLGARLIHISTDAVFSGRKGNYKEEDPADATDTYGKTKLQGEVTGPGALTLRTSFLGRELHNSNGLLEALIAKKGGEMAASVNNVCSGFPTLHLSRIIKDIIINHENLEGLYHVSSAPISNYDLLAGVNSAMGLNISPKKTDGPKEDRSLDSAKFRKAAGFTPDTWITMLKELAEDAAVYSKWR